MKRKKSPNRRTEFIKIAIIVVIIGLVLRLFVFMPYQLKDADMENLLFEGDFLLVSKLAYKFGEPEIGDVVVFEHPFKIGEIRIGRVIATGGKTVEIIGKVIYVNGEPVEEVDYVKHSDQKIIPEKFSNRDFFPPVRVPAGTVYILCDNRDISHDSRDFGAVNVENVKGKGMFVYWSWKPDPNSPRWESPYIFPAVKILFYNLFHFPSRVRWERLGASSK